MINYGRAVSFLVGICIACAVVIGIRKWQSWRESGEEGLEGRIIAGGSGISYSLSPPPMGGVPFTIRVWGRSPASFIEDSRASGQLVEEIEAEVSSWRKESVVSKINRAGRGEAIQLPEHASGILKCAFRLYRISGGAFNPALRPVVELWREAERRGEVPSKEELKEALKISAMEAFVLGPEGRTCRKSKPGAQLDLGGIAKGYMVDEVSRCLQKRGAPAGIVTAGGDLRVFGGSTSRKVGIQHPGEKDKLYGYFYLREGAAATSGNYERSYTIGGKKYGHIIDGRTGKPAEGVLSATVIAPDCTTADGLSTAVFVMGKEEGIRFMEGLPGADALMLVREDGEIRQYRTENFPRVRDISGQGVPSAR